MTFDVSGWVDKTWLSLEAGKSFFLPKLSVKHLISGYPESVVLIYPHIYPKYLSTFICHQWWSKTSQYVGIITSPSADTHKLCSTPALTNGFLCAPKHTMRRRALFTSIISWPHCTVYTKHQGTAQRTVTHSTISNNKNVYTKNPTSVLRFVWFPPFLLFLFVAPFVCVHVVRTCIICMYCMCVVWLCWHMQLLCSVLNSYWQSRADGYFLQFIYIFIFIQFGKI